jgi:uroporphyrinogen III methyltransferase/synthase
MNAGTKLPGPLSGRRILITRAREQSGEFSRLLEAQGAEVLEFPTIRFEPPDSWEAADDAIRRLDRFGFVIFTSANGVARFFGRVESLGGDPSPLGRASLAAIGPKTAAALARRGLRVDALPDSYVAEGLVEALKDRKLAGAEVLIPRAQEARDVLITELERLGAKVTVAPVYRTVRAEESREPIREALEGGRVDVVAFTASSTVNAFADLLGRDRAASLLRGVGIACIGPVTAETLRTLGLSADMIPERYTIPDLAGAIARRFGAAPRT